MMRNARIAVLVGREDLHPCLQQHGNQWLQQGINPRNVGMLFILMLPWLQFFALPSHSFQLGMGNVVPLRRRITLPVGIGRGATNAGLHWKLRGGSVQLSNQEENGDATWSKESFRRRGMSIALASSYFSVMGAKCALPSVLYLLTSTQNGLTFTLAKTSRSSPQSQMAALLGFSTLAVAAGKLLLGPAIDVLGGIRALQLALSCLMSLLIVISGVQPFILFAVAWIFVDFIFSSCWAACINAIHQSFPESRWGQQIGLLAMGARTGNAAAFSLFATVLYFLEGKMRQPWRIVFLVSALLQTFPLGLLAYFGRMTLNQESLEMNQGQSKTTLKDSLSILRKEALRPEFWLHLTSRSCLMVFASFLLFVPTLMSQVYGCSNAVAAQVASVFSLGCLLSVSFGSKVYSSMPKHQQVCAVVCLLSLATLSSLIQLAHVSGLIVVSSKMATLSMFIWGFSMSVPFYIPPSLYALERGGRTCSATLSDSFDFIGFALLAGFNGYVASIAHSQPFAWIGCFQLTTLCSFIALVSQSLAVHLQ